MTGFTNPVNLLPKDGEAYFYPDFFNANDSARLFQNLIDNVPWQQDKIRLFGKYVDLPRKTAWFGDVLKSYTYSGITMHPLKWSDDLLEIKNKIEKISNCKFSGALLNLYGSGKDSMSWHSDNERELGTNPVIASVSLGETRTFKLRNISDKSLVINVDLTPGSLLLMKGATQHHWQHAIPKTAKQCDSRINITFRVIV